MGQLIGHAANLLTGTITATGTLTAEIDLMEYTLAGLIAATTMTNGTLSFQVSPTSDNSTDGGAYVDVKGTDGSNVAYGPLSGTFALKGTDLEFLRPYRYVKIKTSVAQPTGLQFRLPVKA